MNKGVFGVYDDRDAFEALRPTLEFDQVLNGEDVTVGVRDPGIGYANRTSTAQDTDGLCVLFGEVYPPPGVAASPAAWLLDRYRTVGRDAFDEVNGSYVAVVETDGTAVVASDLIRSWECFYTDVGSARVFGTSASAVARTMPSARLAPDAVSEFVHLGGVLNDRTILAGLHRLPHDHCLTATSTEDLGRFVYEPESFDYAAELAERLERAIERRRRLPGKTSLLLSGGYDSRAILAAGADVDTTYTIGTPGRGEASVAAAIADQYSVPHETLTADDRYLAVGPDTVEYTQGVKESLHIHHAGYEDAISTDSVYHGLLWDTLLRGYFQPRDSTSVLGVDVPRRRLDPDPDPVDHLVDVLGFEPESADLLAEGSQSPQEGRDTFAQRYVAPRFEECKRDGETVYDAMARFGVQNVLSSPFRWHLADTYFETLIAADRELVDWHLRTPPEYRTNRTFVDAISRLDDQIFFNRPPDRPHPSQRLNEIEGFLRRALPGVAPYAGAWPDRRAIYEENDLDGLLFPDHPNVHDLPPRLKLRINDVQTWYRDVTSVGSLSPNAVLYPRRSGSSAFADSSTSDRSKSTRETGWSH